AALVERRLELPPLPLGIHRAEVAWRERRATTTVVQAPDLCHAPPGSMAGFGLFAPVYALGAERGAPVGDLGDLAALARLTRDRGGLVTGTLPLLAASYQMPFEVSPYAPVSRLFWNELFLDLDGLVGAVGARREPGTPAAPAASPAGLVDYRAAYAARRPVLERLARHAWAS